MREKVDLNCGDPNLENPSGWIDRSGRYYAVPVSEHDKFAREHLISFYGEEKAYNLRKTDRGKIPFFEVLEKRFQWVRIMAWPGLKTEFIMPRTLTHCMKQTLYKYCKIHNKKLPFTDPIFAYFTLMKSKRDKKYDLEGRTFVFTKNVSDYLRNLPEEITY